MIPILAETGSTAPNFTVHDISHSDALWETAGLVYRSSKLTPPEAWLLGMAFLFHDAAMGQIPPGEDVAERLDAAQWRDLVATTFREMQGRWPEGGDIEDPPSDVYDASIMRALRKTHARRGADLVQKPWRIDGHDEFVLQDDELRQIYGPLIAALAESHWWAVDELPEHFPKKQGAWPGMPDEWRVEPLKLACILRLADATQIDARRAPGFLFARRNPQGVSREHWAFQQHMVRPRPQGDRVVYESARPFTTADMSAWWRAFGYLQEVDRELKRVDALLWDLELPRMRVRAVAGVDTPERFARFFPVEGWEPIDAKVEVSDVRGLVAALGGEQLYGPGRPEVALREAIQNAQDGVLARREMDPEYAGGRVVVRLVEDGGAWTLEVHDDGVGMDADIIKEALLDFGRSGWRIDAVQRAFPGVMAGAFRPAGTFGVGFYSLLMLGREVTVTTRRFDLGAAGARRLTFADGLQNRPVVRPLPERPLVPAGTVVRVVLRCAPQDGGGLLARTSSDGLVELVRQLVPGPVVPLVVEEQRSTGEYLCTELAPFDLASAAPGEVFDRLCPSREGYAYDEARRVEAREEFCAQATEIPGDDGRRAGLAVLGPHVTWRYREAPGLVVLHGFRADRRDDFTGYVEGTPGRASREQVELACMPEQVSAWVASQLGRLRERGLFDASAQLELASFALRAIGRLDDDHCVALTEEGLLRVGDIASWAVDRDEVLFSYGSPCDVETRPPGLRYRPDGRLVTPPPGWLVLAPTLPVPSFDDRLPPQRRDPAYAAHWHDPAPTWQKRWWRVSGDTEGLVLRRIAEGWGCTVGELLGPVAERDWQDFAALLPGVKRSLVLRLARPRPQPGAGTRRTPPSPTAR